MIIDHLLDFTKEQEKDREKEKVGGGPGKLNEKKGDRDLEQRYKKNKSELERVPHILHKTCNEEVSGSFTL